MVYFSTIQQLILPGLCLTLLGVYSAYFLPDEFFLSRKKLGNTDMMAVREITQFFLGMNSEGSVPVFHKGVSLVSF